MATLLTIANAEAGTGHLVKARDCLTEALVLARAIVRAYEPVVPARLARAHFLLGDAAAASACAEPARATLTPNMPAYLHIRVWNPLGDAHQSAEHRMRAQEHFDAIGVIRDAAEPLWWC